MPFVAGWSFPPGKGGVNIVNAGIDAFFRANGFSREHGLRFQACIEGVCNYCTGNLRKHGDAEEIHIRLYWEDRSLRGLVYHYGPGGEWDHTLDARQKGRIRRTSFESLGLFIAHELAAELVCRSQYDVVSGKTVREYEVVYELDGEPGVEAGPA